MKLTKAMRGVDIKTGKDVPVPIGSPIKAMYEIASPYYKQQYSALILLGSQRIRVFLVEGDFSYA